MKIAIIGGGLAGTACAYMLKQAGAHPKIYELSDRLASGASGNETGLYNPRFFAEENEVSVLYAHGFELVQKIFAKAITDIEWNPCGALHLINSDQKQTRYQKLVQNKTLLCDAKIINKESASSIAGIPIEHDALYLPSSGTISPRKLCTWYANDIPIEYNRTVKELSELDEEIIIIANSFAAKQFNETSHFPIRTVRGQVTHIKATQRSQKLQVLVCYGGYLTMAKNGAHVIGSSFDRGNDLAEIKDSDDQENIQKMMASIPVLQGDYSITHRRAGIRATGPGHVPVMGALNDRIYLNIAHGSHGILSSLIGAQIIAQQIMGQPLSLPESSVRALSPKRFTK